ncbi:MAG: type II secretion system protein [Phycisphaeraceae bacterium]|nr:type II secretion system protein [Phycisphaeraceae bacterium]
MKSKGFTLVEILIVVVILGILAAIVVPQYASATDDAKKTATVDQLVKLRQAVSLYYYQNKSKFPSVTSGDGTWGELMTAGYFKVPPANLYVEGPNGTVITLGSSPDSAPTTSYGWIFNPATGDVWAASFDGFDKPLP